MNKIIERINNPSVPEDLECLCFDGIDLIKHENNNNSLITALRNNDRTWFWYIPLRGICHPYNYEKHDYDTNTDFEVYTGHIKYSSKTGLSRINQSELPEKDKFTGALDSFVGIKMKNAKGETVYYDFRISGITGYEYKTMQEAADVYTASMNFAKKFFKTAGILTAIIYAAPFIIGGIKQLL
ncbi:Uncharacterised protein [Candidatus Tiddalikarchaeum anstoanum]|nr:Uncharacterised protein [Candidatus Tiddalikarchaeum anstoanum]